MLNSGIIERRLFSLCMGKNGGYLQMGGYDGHNHLDKSIQWASLLQTTSYKVQLTGISMNNHLIAGSEHVSVGFLDSGTTFTYMPSKLWNEIELHFDWFC